MERSSARLKVFAILVLVMFAALSTRLWFLQVLATQVYADKAQDNGVRTVAIDALRGEIWTADQYGKPNGVPLGGEPQAASRCASTCRSSRRAAWPSRCSRDSSEMLDVPGEEDQRRPRRAPQYFDYQPKPIAEFVPEEVAFAISERAGQFPGVEVREHERARLPDGAHGLAHRSGGSARSQPAQLDQAAKPASTARTTSAGQAGARAAVRAVAARQRRACSATS